MSVQVGFPRPFATEKRKLTTAQIKLLSAMKEHGGALTWKIKPHFNHFQWKYKGTVYAERTVAPLIAAGLIGREVHTITALGQKALL